MFHYLCYWPRNRSRGELFVLLGVEKGRILSKERFRCRRSLKSVEIGRKLLKQCRAGQIRTLRPEIQVAIADGQSLASIRQWLEEEGGIVVTVQSLGSYLTRIRRKETAKASCPFGSGA
jgi:hypothetical protein